MTCMRQHFVFALVLGMLVIVPRLKGGPPDSTFKQATGRMYCGADWGKSGCHGAGAIKLPTGARDLVRAAEHFLRVARYVFPSPIGDPCELPRSPFLANFRVADRS